MLLRREALLARERADPLLISLSVDLADILSLLRLCSAYIYGQRRRSGRRERNYDFVQIEDRKRDIHIIYQVQEEEEEEEGSRRTTEKKTDADLPFGLEVRLRVVGG